MSLKALDTLLKQPYWVIALILGVLLIAGPCVTVDKSYFWQTHPPTTYWLLAPGFLLLTISATAFSYKLVSEGREAANIGAGLDLARVKEKKGVLSTKVGNCEINIVSGKLEEYSVDPETAAVVLPCNEYFDDKCVDDTRSALGAYVNKAFEGRVPEFVSLMKEECKKRLGPGQEQQKTDEERAISFGAGRTILLMKPLGKTIPIALLSTTTQRKGHGLSSRISYLFDAISELVSCLGNERVNEIVMPLLGSGHGGLDPPLALVGLLGAIAEVAKYGAGAQRLKKVTIVLFKRDSKSSPQVDPTVVRRALAIVGSPA